MNAIDTDIKLGLERIAKAVKKLNLNLSKFTSVLIAGTNGKGSTALFLGNILVSHGKKTVVYTSPHIDSFTERILINGTPVDEEILNRYIDKAKRVSEQFNLNLTPFETFTLAFFQIACEFNPEVVVCEVGLGGRLDATNVLPNKISIITSVGLDHRDFLGDSVQEIAAEKAAIIKSKNLVITGKLPKTAEEVVTERIHQTNSTLLRYNRNLQVKNLHFKNFHLVFDLKAEDTIIPNVELPTVNAALAINACLAVSAAQNLIKIEPKTVRVCLKKACIPGRAEVIKRKSNTFILDTAHNSLAIAFLFRSIKKLLNEKPLVILSLLKDKDWQKILNIAKHHAKDVVLIEQNTQRALTPKDAPQFTWMDKESLKTLLQNLKNETVVLAGSFWMVKTAKEVIEDAYPQEM